MTRLLSLFAAIGVLAISPLAVSASQGTPVAFTAWFSIFGNTTTTVVDSDPAGVLCPAAYSTDPDDIVLPNDVAAGPHERGASSTFVGTFIRTVHCEPGNGWTEADSYTVRSTLKGNNDGSTADGSWAFLGGTGQLQELHGHGTILSTVDYFPFIYEYYTGTAAVDPS